MSRVADYQDAGIFPVQDFAGDGVSIGSRLMMAACRVARRPHPESSTDPSKSMLQIARVRGMGTIGDIHPWFYWDMVNRSLRDIGMYSMAHSGLTITGGKIGSGPGGRKTTPSGLVPFHSGHNVDGRFTRKFPNWPKCFSSIPQGVMMMVMPGTLETGQSEHMLHADPRIVAPSVDGPYQAGTLVVDVQPEGEMCMGDGEEPGVVGRAALIQSMMRVIPLNANSGIPQAKDLNGLAWNLAAAGKDKKFPGLGLCWIEMEQGGGGGSGPNTPVFTKPLTPPRGEASGGSSGSPCKFGEFEKASVTGHGVTLMAQKQSCGPLSGGFGSGDKHYIGDDKDGNPITSGHISRNAYFVMDDERDGPLFFEDKKWPKPDDLPMVAHVHLVFDKEEDHKWLKTTKDGQWKWFATVPYMSPDPDFPSSKGPITPGGGGDPQFTRHDLIRSVGDLTTAHRGIFEIYHPMVEGFAQLSFRPQRMVRGLRSFLRNPEATLAEIKADELRRPQVISLRTWGGQSPTGWDYKSDPLNSRIRGGTVDGGILVSPPEFEMESYLGIRLREDIYAASATSFFTCAPGVGFALGTPHKDGGLNAKSVRITQLGGVGLNDTLEIDQLDSSRVARSLFRGELDQASGEVVVDLGTGGNQAARIPRGATAQRPTAITPTGGEIRVLEDDSGNPGTFDQVEYYDADQAAWRQLHSTNRLASQANGDGASLIGIEDVAGVYAATDVEGALQELGLGAAVLAPQAVTFTATTVFAHRHARNAFPTVQVLDSDGKQIECGVDQTDVDTVVLHFPGTTLTDAVLILN